MNMQCYKHPLFILFSGGKATLLGFHECLEPDQALVKVLDLEILAPPSFANAYWNLQWNPPHT